MSNEKKIHELVEKVMNVSISELNDSSSPETIESWDSFNGLLLADELEAAFEIKFTMEEIEDVNSIADIKRHLTNHGIKF